MQLSKEEYVEPDYKLGDQVLLKKEKVTTGLSVKFSDKFDGPFGIIEFGPNFTYKLRNCEGNKVVNSFINATRRKLYHQRQPGDTEDPQNNEQVNMPVPGTPIPQPHQVDAQQPFNRRKLMYHNLRWASHKLWTNPNLLHPNLQRTWATFAS